MNLQRQLQDIANARRVELLPYIYQKTNGKVLTGPFAGMVIIPQTTWGDGDTAAKLLGVYEDELHEWIYDAVERKPDFVLNVGCAEGYYAVGMSRLLPNVAALAIDINPACSKVVGENIMANVINGLDVLIMDLTVDLLEDRLRLTENALVIMDCESQELALLDPVQAPSLRHCSVIVECHDCQVPGITETLIERFYQTHDIQQTKQQYKDPYQFDFLDNLSDCDKWALVHEGRPSSMTWLYMTPK